MDEKLNQYICDHISQEPPVLAKTYRDTYLHHLYPRMCSGHIQGRLLNMITSMIQPKRVLELGTFTGYSALSIAEALTDEAMLHTVEIDDESADELRQRFDSAEYGSKIVLHIGDALDMIDTIDESWDMVFIDANKRHYLQYYHKVIGRVKIGGYILADNTLWDGKVIENPPESDLQTRGIMEFNDFVAQDPRVEVAMIPIRDGLTIIRKISD